MSAPSPRTDEFPQVPAELADFRPRVALVLGSGLGSFADACDRIFEVPYADVPGLPQSKVPGHAGKFVGATLGGVPLLLAMGRVHYYEGHTARQIAAHVRLMASLGPDALILTNAAGTLNPEFSPGEWMMLSDHLNLTAVSPMFGGPNFFDMSGVYAPELRAVFRELARRRAMDLHEGVYACVPGPQYETPAEVRMLRTLGADAVGMSTVFEAIQARALGVRVAAFSCLTNWAAGVIDAPLSHEEVMETGKHAASVLSSLLEEALRRGLPES
ncbi:MAG: purine-nucleoside phosphorylase [Chthoniobacterales bacterium]|nr:purine-nucleoside phosphorylase [Chthoniobacterales bacterium]